jgi:predicted MFS family arabinose efflux permease
MTAPVITRNFVLLVIPHFLQALGYSSMLLLPLYLQHLGASRTEIGALMATAALSGLLTRPLVAWSLDRMGRKPTLVVGTLLLSLGMVMIAGVDEIGVVIYLERIVFGMGVGALFSAYFTFAADLIPPERRTEGLALFGISGLVPLLINPIADRIGIAPADLRWFLPLCGGVIALGLFALWVLPEPPPVEGDRPPMRQALVALRQPSLWSVWLATVAFSGLVAVFMTFATVAAERRGVDKPSSLWLGYAVGAVTVRLFGARLPDRVGPSKLVPPALGLYAGAMWLVGSAQSFNAFLVAALLAGIGHGYCFPVLSSQVVTRSPATFRGSAMAFFTALWGLSELVLSPAFGAVADATSDATMFHSASIAGLVALCVWAALELRFGATSNAT